MLMISIARVLPFDLASLAASSFVRSFDQFVWLRFASSTYCFLF